MGKKQTSVKLDNDLIEKLKGMKHPGQSFNGVILELINGAKKK
jgi:predicted CopG family antitoxin